VVRNRILTNFELATQVNTSEEERKRLLHFVVVGGGPTGVEFSAEFYDFFQQVSVEGLQIFTPSSVLAPPLPAPLLYSSIAVCALPLSLLP
jgi:NADH dehydrogenase FAD-containing subunit